MSKLASELQRLYLLPEQEVSGANSQAANPKIALLSSTGLVRCMVISVKRGSAWTQVATLFQGVQDELDLPAPAISVSVEDGYQIWLSLAEPVALQLAQAFMAGLVRKYLGETKAALLKLRPGLAEDLAFVPQIPAKQATADRWSAYIDPSMGSMFVEESWLEMAPNLDKQAGMLAGLKSIGSEEFERALTLLETKPETVVCSVEPQSLAPNADAGGSKINAPGFAGHFNNPKSFLLAVMNDPNTNTEQRIQAAIALLPYFESDTAN